MGRRRLGPSPCWGNLEFANLVRAPGVSTAVPDSTFHAVVEVVVSHVDHGLTHFAETVWGLALVLLALWADLLVAVHPASSSAWVWVQDAMAITLSSSCVLMTLSELNLIPYAEYQE